MPEGSADPRALREKILRVLRVSVVILSRINERPRKSPLPLCQPPETCATLPLGRRTYGKNHGGTEARRAVSNSQSNLTLSILRSGSRGRGVAGGWDRDVRARRR